MVRISWLLLQAVGQIHQKSPIFAKFAILQIFSKQERGTCQHHEGSHPVFFNPLFV